MATRLLGALALAAAVALTLVAAGWTTGLPITFATAQVDQLEITASRSSASADGGRVEITVRLPAARGVTPPSVTLTTDLGAFGADSGRCASWSPPARAPTAPDYRRRSCSSATDVRASLRSRLVRGRWWRRSR